MAVARRDFVHFQLRIDGELRMCRITRSALLIRERLEMRDDTTEVVLRIFERNKIEIEKLAITIVRQCPAKRRKITITTAEFPG
ncbi:DUF1488 family protein [Tardiphaga sp.]|uniref:DUF1488 family protein n=1 Tax=Tardiphaga sp. TaxID=1926292 RepID=UPI002A5CBB32|nr:hypothetical protein [Tardiphaga sp.]